MVTYQQVKAIQEYRYGKRPAVAHGPQSPRRDPGSVHELLAALAAGLASIGVREPRSKVGHVAPAH